MSIKLAKVGLFHHEICPHSRQPDHLDVEKILEVVEGLMLRLVDMNHSFDT